MVRRVTPDSQAHALFILLKPEQTGTAQTVGGHVLEVTLSDACRIGTVLVFHKHQDLKTCASLTPRLGLIGGSLIRGSRRDDVELEDAQLQILTTLLYNTL